MSVVAGVLDVVHWIGAHPFGGLALSGTAAFVGSPVEISVPSPVATAVENPGSNRTRPWQQRSDGVAAITVTAFPEHCWIWLGWARTSLDYAVGATSDVDWPNRSRSLRWLKAP